MSRQSGIDVVVDAFIHDVHRAALWLFLTDEDWESSFYYSHSQYQKHGNMLHFHYYDC